MKQGVPEPFASTEDCLRLAVPGDRMMEQDTLDFLANCGLRVSRPSSRQYIGNLSAVPSVTILFQRSIDIPKELDDEAVDVAILGLERFLESRDEKGESVVLMPDLGYSYARLVIAVPSSMVNVRSMADLADKAREFERKGSHLRIATKYQRQVGRFLDQHQVPSYRLVHVTGGVEAAPQMGTADIVSDLASSGGTLRENNLNVLEDGIIVESSACIVANKKLLGGNGRKLEATKTVLELIESRLRAEGSYSIIANIRGDSTQKVAELVMQSPDVSGMQGPTVSQVISKTGETGWYSVSMVTPISRLTQGIDHLRSIGASGVVVFPAQYVFGSQCDAYQRLIAELGSSQ